MKCGSWEHTHRLSSFYFIPSHLYNNHVPYISYVVNTFTTNAIPLHSESLQPFILFAAPRHELHLNIILRVTVDKNGLLGALPIMHHGDLALAFVGLALAALATCARTVATGKICRVLNGGGHGVSRFAIRFNDRCFVEERDYASMLVEIIYTFPDYVCSCLQ